MKATIVIPTYDEADALPDLLVRVLELPQRFHVLVVDDASPDGTGELADAVAAREPRVKVLHRPGKMGLGSAYRDGFARAMAEGADVIFEMDADHSHNPKYLPALLEPLRADADVTVGSRYVHGIRVENWPFRRLLLSRFANYYVSLACGMPAAVLMDATSGFRGYRREVLETIGLDRVRSNGYSFQVETSYRAILAGLDVREVPIVFVDRRAGHSKMSRRIFAEAVWMVVKLRWRGSTGQM